jgi:hypothetical protein
VADSDKQDSMSLEDQVKILVETVSRMDDALKQTTATQNQLAHAALKAKEIADAAMSELERTKSELAKALIDIKENSNAALASAIKQGMSGFVEEVRKSTDERITQILGSQATVVNNQPGGPDGASVRPAGSMGGIGDLIKEVLDSDFGKALATKFLAPPVAQPQMQMGDMFAGFLKFEKLLGDLSDVRKNLDSTKIEQVRKDTNEAFKVPAT